LRERDEGRQKCWKPSVVKRICDEVDCSKGRPWGGGVGVQRSRIKSGVFVNNSNKQISRAQIFVLIYMYLHAKIKV
jgi:hypothetical protein